MKKIFSTLIVITTIFVFTAFADDPLPTTTCADGHMHLPGYACTPPRDGETGQGNRTATDDSTLTYIKSLIDEYNFFVYFLK